MDLGLVTEQELSDSIATEFNPVHIGFYDEAKPHPDIVAHDVLNLGVNPRYPLVPPAFCKIEQCVALDQVCDDLDDSHIF